MQALDFQKLQVTIPFTSDMIESQSDLELCLIAAGAKPTKDFVGQRWAEHCKIIADRERGK